MDKKIYEGVLDTDEDHHGKIVWLGGKTIENILDEFEGKEIRLIIEERGRNITKRKCFDCDCEFEENEMEQIMTLGDLMYIYVCRECLIDSYVSLNDISIP